MTVRNLTTVNQPLESQQPLCELPGKSTLLQMGRRGRVQGGCRAQKPALPTSHSAACKGHSEPGALVTQAGRATTRFRGPSSGGGALG